MMRTMQCHSAKVVCMLAVAAAVVLTLKKQIKVTCHISEILVKCVAKATLI